MKNIDFTRNMTTSKLLTITVLSLIVLAPMVAQAESNQNSGVLSPQEKEIYEELSVKWWQWALEIPNKPSSIHPILDKKGKSCDTEQSGPVWFLAGTAGGTAERSCTIPKDKAILVPIINAATWIPTDGTTKGEIKQAAKSLMDHVTEVETTVDGIKLKNLKEDYRFQSKFFTFTGPDNPDETIYPGQSGILT